MNRHDLLYDHKCPVCEERFDLFQDLYEHLLEHCDEDIAIAEDFLEECMRLAAEEELSDEGCPDN